VPVMLEEPNDITSIPTVSLATSFRSNPIRGRWSRCRNAIITKVPSVLYSTRPEVKQCGLLQCLSLARWVGRRCACVRVVVTVRTYLQTMTSSQQVLSSM
jgi:hypothetical protein